MRQREQAPVIHGIGDIVLDAATKLRLVYPIYVLRRFLEVRVLSAF